MLGVVAPATDTEFGNRSLQVDYHFSKRLIPFAIPYLSHGLLKQVAKRMFPQKRALI